MTPTDNNFIEKTGCFPAGEKTNQAPDPAQVEHGETGTSVNDGARVFARVMEYHGKTRREVANPCLTARECIALANYIHASDRAHKAAIPAPEGAQADERAAFEAWCKVEQLNVNRVSDEGNYANSGTWMAWHAWQARAALAAPAPKEWRCPDTGRLCTAEDCDRVCFQAPAEGDLTSEQIEALVETSEAYEFNSSRWHVETLRRLVRATLAAANVQPKHTVEPVAWYADDEDGSREYNGSPRMSNGRTGKPLYAAPQPPAEVVEVYEALFGASNLVTTNHVTAAAHLGNGRGTLLLQYADDAAAERACSALWALERIARRPAASQAPAPAQGSWVRAEDVQRLARDLDVAINGEAAAAPAPQLCDVVAQAIGIMDARRAEFPVVARWTKNAKDGAPRARVWVQFEDGGPEVEFASDLQAPAVGAEDARDAARYRWLRDKPTWSVDIEHRSAPQIMRWSVSFPSYYGTTETEDSLDAAIDAEMADAARKAQPPVQHKEQP